MKSIKKKKKTDVEEIEEFLVQQGFREVTKKELREMRPVKPARKTSIKKKSVSEVFGMLSKKSRKHISVDKMKILLKKHTKDTKP
jgi:hypothetical protein